MENPTKLLINGEWVSARSGKTYDDFNPATGEVHWKIAEAGPEDVNIAVASARQALEKGPWGRKISAHKRSKLLWKVGELIEKNLEEFAKLETADTGKPITDTLKIDVPMSADVFYYFSGAASKLEGNTIPVQGNFFNYTLREPLGVVGLIVPWNFPLLILARKVAAALAAGNCVIIKPASETPLSALKLGEVCMEAGIPAGVVNVLTGKGSVMGNAIVGHPDVDGVSFTGSTEVGQQLMKTGAGNVKRLSLELGGKSPNIVFADSDLDTASKYALAAIFYNAGEVCTAGSRLLVEKTVHDEFMDKVISKAQKMTYGDPLDPNTRLGPLVSKSHRDSVHQYVEAGKAEGAKLVAGGSMGEGKGYFYKPTVFDNVQPNMKIAQEEIFGPVLAALSFDNFDNCVEIANNSQFGLACGIWTKDIKKAHRLAKEVKAGTVWINTYNMYDAAMPYGGFKMSGYGYDSGLKSLDFYTKNKSIWVDLY